MSFRFFSTKNRPVHMGPFPMEYLKRVDALPDLTAIPAPASVSFNRADVPSSIVNAMRDYQAVLDAIRTGKVNEQVSNCPSDPPERANHIKAFGYFSDATMVGICRLPADCSLDAPIVNPEIERLADEMMSKQVKTLAAGIDIIMAELRESLSAPPQPMGDHTHGIVVAFEHPRDPKTDEPGSDWIMDAQQQRAGLRAAEAACVIANYLRLLGHPARAHTVSASDVNMDRLAVAAGLATLEDGEIVNPYLGSRFSLACITTTFEMTADKPLAPLSEQPRSKTHGVGWWLGKDADRNARNVLPFGKRRYVDGAHPFETLKRKDAPTTFIDEERVARVPKRTDMFARAQFGDMGKPLQAQATGGYYMRKSATAYAQRGALGALLPLQDGPAASTIPEHARNPITNADNIKAAAYFLGADAVGLSRCPEWVWYSHDAAGEEIHPTHGHAISLIIDQGFETTEGTSGDDWIAVAQSMRAYLRFSLIGGVLGKHIRSLGYEAQVHTVMAGEVLQPPLLLLAGLGEVSRIGEVILNPFLGPRLKSGCITTTMPMEHDKPIDFGLQKFCESCNKCARECPAGAITAGPKTMFNGYEIWKSDSQKCTTYRITTPGGAMCGRCMKTCPWNLEGLFAEEPFRWAAMNAPQLAPALAKLDDMVGHGEINPVKTWWWNLKIDDQGGYQPVDETELPVNRRKLSKNLDLKFEDQTLAVYPANLAPHPWPFPFPMDREKGIEAYQAMITAQAYKAKLERNEIDGLSHEYKIDGEAPVIPVIISKVEHMSDLVTKYEFAAVDGSDLPAWQAGAHLDIVVAPEFLRQYSMSGDPADRSKYQIGVLREDSGRGGSKLMHRIFSEGRKLFVSRPINHFPVAQDGTKHLLVGGGIGITPMIAFAHELHRESSDFELHYCIPSRKRAGYLKDLQSVPWADRLFLHVSDEGTRADLATAAGTYREGHHIYTCGPDQFMDAVIQSAELQGFPETACHLEYFSVPEQPDYVNHPFTLRLARSGTEIEVGADEVATDALARAGIVVDVKCSDGICGVCKCGLISGEAEHRDFVLSKAQRQTQIILCQSRAAEADGVLEVDL